MNGTTAIYSEVEQAIIPLAGLVLCPLLSIPIYVIARYRSSSEQTSLTSMAYVFYNIISGVMFGQVLALYLRHSEFPMLYMVIFTAVGYVIFNVAESIGRSWKFNDYLPSPQDYEHMNDEDVPIDARTGVIPEARVTQNISDPTMGEELVKTNKQKKISRKRMWMLACVLFIFFMNSFLTGLRLIYRLPSTDLAAIEIIICYFVNALTLSFVVYGVMIHAHLHRTEGNRRRILTWIILTLLWSIIYFVSAILVLARLQWSMAAFILEHPATNVFNGLAAGILWKMQFYFHIQHNDEKSSGCQRVTGHIFFVLAIAQAIATNFWL